MPKRKWLFWNLSGVIVKRKSEINPYAAIVGRPPAEIKDWKAFWLGRMVQMSTAPKTYITVTALRGWPFGATRLTQEERGSAPSRATAKTRREEATTATLVPCVSARIEPLFLESVR